MIRLRDFQTRSPVRQLDLGRTKNMRAASLEAARAIHDRLLRADTGQGLNFSSPAALSPDKLLKNDAGRDLWAVGRGLPDEAVAVVFIISIEIAEAEFGIDAPRDLTAESGGDLRCDVRTSPKTADVHLACKIKSFG